MGLFKKIVSVICSVGDSLKPLLIKILPISVYKKIKSGLIKTAFTENKRLPYDNYYPFGINLIGYIKAQMGLGQGSRLIAKAIEYSEIPFTIIDTKVGNPFNHQDETWIQKISNDFKYSINIFHVNPEQMPPLQLTLPGNALDRRYNIGIWLWELPEFPSEWENAFNLVDEVWAPSVFNCESIRTKANCPVTLIPYGITAPSDPMFTREYFNLPADKFLFLTMYDANSTIQRKNPIGAVKAFRLAFPPENKSVGLVIKINNPKHEDLALISNELEGYDNIYIIKETLSKIAVNSLIKEVDSYISLHRAEGFGLVIAEAMLLGTPTIATNWSANTDFMTNENSCPVDYEIVEILEDCYSYKAHQHWAEPSISSAASFMKRLVLDSEYYEKTSINGKNFIEQNFSIKHCAQTISARINEIAMKLDCSK